MQFLTNIINNYDNEELKQKYKKQCEILTNKNAELKQKYET